MLSVDCRSLLQMLDVHLRSLCCCRSCMRHVRRRVATQSIMYLLPLYTRTHKKKKKNCTCYKRLMRRFVTYGIRAKFNPRLGITTAFVDIIDYTVVDRVVLCACR
jgi:hypothetical protein